MPEFYAPRISLTDIREIFLNKTALVGFCLKHTTTQNYIVSTSIKRRFDIDTKLGACLPRSILKFKIWCSLLRKKSIGHDGQKEIE